MDSTAVDGSNKSISPGHGQRLSSHESDLLESSGEQYRSNARREVFEGPIAGIVVTTYSSLISPKKNRSFIRPMAPPPKIQHLGLAGGVTVSRTNAWLA